jgi:hypothetical protein
MSSGDLLNRIKKLITPRFNLITPAFDRIRRSKHRMLQARQVLRQIEKRPNGPLAMAARVACQHRIEGCEFNQCGMQFVRRVPISPPGSGSGFQLIP